ncbi:MAG: hypothetical protein RMI34_04300 [Chloroherpetonaceae bacterium]|nr:hypothetical protein [Chloroherpetonaceae bacterium]
MVVPYLFDHQGWLTLERETLRPGEIRRYFFAVPSDASALTVSIVRQGKQPCEVSGALVTPRGAVAMPISAPADDEQESNVSLTRELEAGIYEVVLQAESGARQPSCFTFEVAIERVSINPTVVTPALLRAKVVNTNSETVRGSLSARISSYVKTHFDTLYAGQIYRLPILLSEKDVALTVKLMLTKEDYNKNTDIGLLILDSLGRKLVAQPVDAATKSIRFVNVYDNPAQVFFEVHYGFADDSPRNFVRLCIEEIHAIQPVTLSSQMNLSVELLPFVPVMLEWQIPNDLPQIPRGYTYRGDLRFEDLFNQLKSIQSFLVPRY